MAVKGGILSGPYTSFEDSIETEGYLFTRLRQLGIRSVFGVGNCNGLNAAYTTAGYARINGLSALITTLSVGELSDLSGIAGACTERPLLFILGRLLEISTITVLDASMTA
ncbi:unnamed protein product [Penicillium camemberti]|uniref:Str. FM013 n=1 Tax=Penicillium camemberti (strain FM 013) TaxID=1429867 RepID=A0A0G4PP36_PENC3|nr:unnamed protein product [Penicillium camemberti]